MRMHVLLLAAACALASGASLKSGGCDSNDDSFDYLLLVQQWPPSYSNNRTYSTLHGLWPSRGGSRHTSYPCLCTDEALDLKQLKPLLQVMDKFWPSLESSNAHFWSHEWTKHGTCAKMASQLAFFNATLTLRNHLDFHVSLVAGGIKPGSTNSAATIKAALKKRVGVEPLLGCQNTNELAEVAFCINSKTLEPQVCDAAVAADSNDETNNCPATGIVWPTAGPGPGPAPNGQCLPNTHGPACSADDDCKGFADCVRCAGSGFCTSVPR